MRERFSGIDILNHMQDGTLQQDTLQCSSQTLSKDIGGMWHCWESWCRQVRQKKVTNKKIAKGMDRIPLGIDPSTFNAKYWWIATTTSLVQENEGNL